MEKQKYRRVAANLVTVIILSTLAFLVFRKDYRSILDCLSHVSIRGLLMLLGLESGYQLLDSIAQRILIRTRAPSFGLKQAVDITFLGIFGNVSTFSVGIIPMQGD